ncbi:MAG: transglutaminase-like domain-containing protein [bacterium]
MLKKKKTHFKEIPIEKKQNHHYCLKSFLITATIIVFAVIVLGIIYWQYAKFPSLSSPITKTYTWDYKETPYTLNETLYKSTAEYYGKKIKGIYSNFEENSISKYFKYPKQDKSISEVANKIKLSAEQGKLTPDQTIDLTLDYVQSLPYDEIRAKTDLTHPRYPYETLYEGIGICSDKTLLTVAILRELGYGTAVFMYESDQHMAPAVQCPTEYSNYNSGYCIAETTAIGHKIGIVPELDQKSLQAVSRAEVPTFENQIKNPLAPKILSTPKIYSKTSGNIYQGVIQTVANEKEIAEISVYLGQQKIRIDASEAELTRLKRELNMYDTQENIKKYNSLVPTYNNLVATVKAQIEEYNQKVNRYNYLIKQ